LNLNLNDIKNDSREYNGSNIRVSEREKESPIETPKKRGIVKNLIKILKR
jgi:hypothetical protein